MTIQCPAYDTGCAPWAECYVNGFLPCSSTFLGNLFLYVIYCTIIYFASQTIFQSSTKLLYMIKTTSRWVYPYVGFVYPILNILPLLIIAMASTFGEPPTELQQKRFNVGIGGMMGTIFFSLTIPWAFTLIVGRCDLSNGEMAENVLSGNQKILTQTGITIDKDTRFLSLALLLSVFCYFILQIAIFFSKNDDVATMTSFQKPFLVTSSIIAFLLFVIYMIWNFWKRNHVMYRKINEAHRQQVVHHVIDQFRSRLTAKQNDIANTNVDFPDGWETKLDHDINKNIPKQTLIMQLLLIVFSITLLVFFSYPLVESIMNFCSHIGINSPELYTSYITMPIVCYGYFYIIIIEEAGLKRKKNISFSISSLYSMSILTNTLILSLFTMAIVWRDLVWIWTAESYSIIFICIFVGLLTTIKTTLVTSWAVIWIFFPIALVGISLLDSYSYLD